MGLGLAFAWAGTAPPETGPQLLSYTVFLLPLGAAIGAMAGRSLGLVVESDRRARGRALLGATLGVLGALTVAQVLAAMRFWRLGANGVLPSASFRYAAESLMVLGLLPGGALLGAGLAQLSRAKWAIAGLPALAGGLIAALAGPMLIGSAAAGRAGISPPILLVVGWVLVGWVGWRRVRRPVR